MIELQVIFTIALIIAISLITMFSNKIKVAYPVLLVLAGLAASFIPQVPTIAIDPHLIFIIFLPPLLYEAALASSWKEIWRWRRIIISFAFPVVFITACAVAFVANSIIPGFSLTLGFLLGGIVSPPDAVSAAAIMKFVKVPKRISTVLEGESLFNDASSLVIVRFAMVVMATGQFIWYQAAGQFLWMVVGGVGVGVLCAIIMIFMHKRLPMTTNIDIVFTLIAPYIMYLFAEEVEASGVMAVVSGGLWMKYHELEYMSASARVKGENVWSNFTFLLNGFVFILIGLDLPEIMNGLSADHVSIVTATVYGLIISALLMVVRISVAYLAVPFTQVMSRIMPVADDRIPPKGMPFILGWTGMRGVVSLASALSIPLTLAGTAYPHRSLILYITFIVILVTLILQGLTLPYIIRNTRFPDDLGDHLDEEEAHQQILDGISVAGLKYINSHSCPKIDESILFKQAVERFRSRETEDEVNDHMPREEKEYFYHIFDAQRQWLDKYNKENSKADESIVREFIHRIDLWEINIKHQ